jgi:haloalkane dehalogenase
MTPDTGAIKDIYPFEPRFARIGVHNMHYVDEGSGPQVALMVHGNPTWSFYYRNLVMALKKDFRAVAPDHIGCGLSDKPQDYPYTLETHINNLETLAVSLNLDNISLIVHDWGAAIGMGFAVRHPSRIKKIVVLNSAAFSMRQIPWRIAMAKIPVLGPFLSRRMNMFCRFAQTMTVEKPMPPNIAAGYMLPYQSYEDRVAVQRFVEDIPLGPEHPSYETLLQVEHGLWMFREIPACVCWGMRDWCFTPAFMEKWLLFLPQATVNVYPAAGHYVLEDGGEEIISDIRRFLLRKPAAES